MTRIPGEQDDGAFHHAETVDAYPRLSNADLDRIDRQRQQRRRHHALRAAAIPAGAVILLTAAGLIGWRVTAYDSAHQLAITHTPPAHTIVPAARHHPAAPAETASPSPPAAAAPAVIYNCESQPLTEPAGYTLARADGNGGLSSLTWTSWTASEATGSGQYYSNTCNPDCAQGTFTYTPVTVTLSDPLATTNGGECFTLMTVSGEGTWQLGPDGPGCERATAPTLSPAV
jgi:hypothetical protein